MLAPVCVGSLQIFYNSLMVRHSQFACHSCGDHLCHVYINKRAMCITVIYLRVVGGGAARTVSLSVYFLARAPLGNVVWWEPVRNYCIRRSVVVEDSDALELPLRRSTKNKVPSSV